MDLPRPAVALMLALAVIVGGGCDASSAPEGMDGELIVRRGPDGSTEMVDHNAFWAGFTAGGTSGGRFSCQGVEACWTQCPKPRQDGGSTTCSCKKVGRGDDDSADDDQFLCDVTFYGPGEHPFETGGSGGRCGGGSGGGPGDDELLRGLQANRCVLTKCGDARDGLAKEYEDERIWGDWPCTKFKKSATGLIGVGTSGYHSKHNGYGLVSSNLTAGIARTEAHFNINMVYTSGYRCPVRNAAISESSNPYTSHHIFGQAVDFRTATGWTAELKDTIFRWGLNNAVWTYPAFTDG